MLNKNKLASMATTTNVTSGSTVHNPTFNNPCSNYDANSCKMYKGVRKRKWGKWVSEIRLPNSRERIWLGSYDTQEKAARAFDAALYCLRGRHANFNFPDTPLSLEITNAHSLSHHEIQEVAQKFANDITPLIESENISQEDEDQEEEEPSLESQNGANSLGLFESNLRERSILSPVYDYDGTMQVDHGDMRAIDWTFFNMLDHDSNYNNIGVAGYDFGLYYGLDKVHSGESLYSTPPPTLFEDNNNGEEIEGDDAFSNHSFLWSWNF